MRWGLTRAERAARFRAKMEKLSEPRPYYAWLPTHLRDGGWAWLEMIARYRGLWTAGEITGCSSGYWFYIPYERAFGKSETYRKRDWRFKERVD